MSIKKYTLTTAFLLFSASSFSADTVQFTVEASIPSSEFYVIPDGDWNISPVRMNYDPTSSSLKPRNVGLRAKNTNGGIEAYLELAPQLVQVAGEHTIPLEIRVAGKELPVGSGSAIEVLDATQAATEKEVSVQIKQSSSAILSPGDYFGTVTIMFDAMQEA